MNVIPTPAVGLLVMYRSNYILYALLQRRGMNNHETRRRETWANSYQPTAHGKIEPFERLDAVTILREARQELGEQAALQLAIEFISQPPTLIAKTCNEAMAVTTYAVMMPVEFIDVIRLGPSTGGLHSITVEELPRLRALKPEEKISGVADNNDLAMFDHNITAVKKAFKVFG